MKCASRDSLECSPGDRCGVQVGDIKQTKAGNINNSPVLFCMTYADTTQPPNHFPDGFSLTGTIPSPQHLPSCRGSSTIYLTNQGWAPPMSSQLWQHKWVVYVSVEATVARELLRAEQSFLKRVTFDSPHPIATRLLHEAQSSSPAIKTSITFQEWLRANRPEKVLDVRQGYDGTWAVAVEHSIVGWTDGAPSPSPPPPCCHERWLGVSGDRRAGALPYLTPKPPLNLSCTISCTSR